MHPLSAPGKLFLAGEYAVLERGRPALVLAVDRLLHAQWEPLSAARVELVHEPSGARAEGQNRGASIEWSGPPVPQLRFAARAAGIAARLCSEEARAPQGLRLVFEDDLALAPEQRGDPAPKLGLGGSAAASVIAVRAVCEAHGRKGPPEHTLALALAAHWMEQGGRGSGGDVAASALGGALEVRVRHAWEAVDAPLQGPLAKLLEDPPLAASAVPLPPELRLLLAWSGQPVDTRTMIAEVSSYKLEAPARYARIMDEIAFAAEGLRDALRAAHQEHNAFEAVLAGVRRAGVAMAVLGDESGVPIMTPALMHLSALASLNGCAAKPSGAGGGDCAVVVCWGDTRREGMREIINQYGYLALPIDIQPKFV